MQLRAALVRTALALPIGGGAAACIIPDSEIQIESGVKNPAAVRVLERPPMHPQMEDLCNVSEEAYEAGTLESFASVLPFCPTIPASAPPAGLIRSIHGPFCTCPQGSFDARAIPAFDIYAEDAWWDGDRPRDTLYGVLRLDPDPNSRLPEWSVAYWRYLEPCAPGQRVENLWPLEEPEYRRPYAQSDPDAEASEAPIRNDRIAPSDARAIPPIWVFHVEDVGGGGAIDLCNGTSNVRPGRHTLQFLVTDRPFFRPRRPDGTLGHEQCGVPDLAAGATYAVKDWVFECIDGTVADADCDCREFR